MGFDLPISIQNRRCKLCPTIDSGARFHFTKAKDEELCGERWPDNALRHSFASYHLAHFRNAATTALELGHHDSRITFRHYRELVKPKEAARFWSIRPAATEKVVHLPAD